MSHTPIATALLAPLAAVAVLAAPARADVIVVDPQGLVGGQLLQAAIAAAEEGDVLLLRDGDYRTLHSFPYQLGDKSLSLVADAGDTPVILSGVRVEGLTAGKSVRLRGLHLRPQGPTSQLNGLTVMDCDGIVVAEDCSLVGTTELVLSQLSLAGMGLHVHEAEQVTLARCIVYGGDGPDESPNHPAGPGGTGVGVQEGRVALFDCEVVGGRGGDGETSLVQPSGGNGLWLLEGTAIVSGGLLLGGDDGLSSTIIAEPGSGLSGSPSAEVRVRGATILAGQVNGLGTPAPDIDLPPGSLVEDPAAPRTLGLPAPLREGQVATMSIGGLQGDMVFVLASTDPSWVPDVLHQGLVAVSTVPVLCVVVATITAADGQLAQPFTTPVLPAGADGTHLALQAVHFGSDGITLGAPSSGVWIDAAF